eukprot:m.161310 g.161310  ORF g.161310 m.161310 type:complete len:843 (+) comp31226_c0_seq2:472-3000(+)
MSLSKSRVFSVGLVVVCVFWTEATFVPTPTPTLPPFSGGLDPTPGCIAQCSNFSTQYAWEERCFCDPLCDWSADECCQNYHDSCDGAARSGTCAGNCFNPVMGGNDCYCDVDCISYGDCCDDYELVCIAEGSCYHPSQDHCGLYMIPHNSSDPAMGTCSCAADCVMFGDCCADYLMVCDETFAPTQAPIMDMGYWFEDLNDCPPPGGSSVEFDEGMAPQGDNRRRQVDADGTQPTQSSSTLLQQQQVFNSIKFDKLDDGGFYSKFVKSHVEPKIETKQTETDLCPAALTNVLDLLKGCVTPSQVRCRVLYRPLLNATPATTAAGTTSTTTRGGDDVRNTVKLSIQFSSEVPASLIRYYHSMAKQGMMLVDRTGVNITFRDSTIASVAESAVGATNPTRCNPGGLFALGQDPTEVEMLRDSNNLLVNSAVNGSIIVNGVDLLRTLNKRDSDQLDDIARIKALEVSQKCETANDFLHFYDLSSQNKNTEPVVPIVRSTAETMAAPKFCTTPLPGSFSCPSHCDEMRSKFLSAFPYLKRPLECAPIAITVSKKGNSESDLKQIARVNNIVAQFQQAACPAYQLCMACAVDKDNTAEPKSSWAAISRSAYALLAQVNVDDVEEHLKSFKVIKSDTMIWGAMVRIMKATPQFQWYDSTSPPSFDFARSAPTIAGSNLMWEAFSKFTPESLIGTSLLADLNELHETYADDGDEFDFNAVLERSLTMGAFASFTDAVMMYLEQYRPQRYPGQLSRRECQEVYLKDITDAVDESMVYTRKIKGTMFNIDEEKNLWQHDARMISLMNQRTNVNEELVKHITSAPPALCRDYSWEKARMCFDTQHYEPTTTP